ncbi:hydroxymethylpyrimidine/phosphomethylpyrimidine kinase [Mesorhizobium sp. WSM2239]|uniref:hydroxymethylpyrimidine kinase n=2 Tax=unclassified Mesorhizobium TaxID=325217 RepID=A0AAU8DH66_9HYPH
MDRGDRAVALRRDPHVLVIAGSDSSGGAGIARDIETSAAFGLRACLAVTAVTAQTHETVRVIEFMPPDLVVAQMRAAFQSNQIAAVKIGMLGTKIAAEAIATVLVERGPVPVVLDPVLASTSGRALTNDGMATFKRLLRLCCLVTPNLPELATFAASKPAKDEAEILMQAWPLFDAGAPVVLAKGGHSSGEWASDLLLRPDCEPVRFETPRLNRGMRGTGCMLATAIAAQLALDAPLEDSVRVAKQYVFHKLRATARAPTVK